MNKRKKIDVFKNQQILKQTSRKPNTFRNSKKQLNIKIIKMRIINSKNSSLKRSKRNQNKQHNNSMKLSDNFKRHMGFDTNDKESSKDNKTNDSKSSIAFKDVAKSEFKNTTNSKQRAIYLSKRLKKEHLNTKQSKKVSKEQVIKMNSKSIINKKMKNKISDHKRKILKTSINSLNSESEIDDIGTNSITNIYNIKDKKDRATKFIRNKDKSLELKKSLVNNVEEKLKSNVDTVDIGTNSVVSALSTTRNISNIKSIRNTNYVFSRKRVFNNRRKVKCIRNIKTSVNACSNNNFKTMKIKQKFMKNKLRKEKKIKMNYTKRSIKIFKKLIKKLSLNTSSIAAGLAMILILFVVLIGSTTGGISIAPSSESIMTTDQQNEMYLKKYTEIKEGFNNEFKNLVQTEKSTSGAVVVEGLDSEGNVPDINFLELMAILTVKIEQDFKGNDFEYDYMKEIIYKMYSVTKTQETYDLDGREQVKTTIKIEVKSYEEIKSELGFNKDELEWMDRLVKTNSLDGHISDIPGINNLAQLGQYGNPGLSYDDETIKKLFAEGEKHIGKAYVFGASGPKNFDCSSFVCWTFTKSGVKNLPRTTAQGLFNQTTAISPSEAKPGDLIFFTGTYKSVGAVSHIGIYAGEGMMLHTGNPTSYTSINSNYWKKHFYAFGRL